MHRVGLVHRHHHRAGSGPIRHQADDLGVFAIGIQGGEPLIWNDLPDLLQEMQTERFNVSLVTNGLLLDTEKAKELKDLGVDRMCISIDSGIAEEHDGFRNYPGAFSKAIEGIESCIQVGLTPHIHTVVTHESLYSEGFDRIRNYAKKMNLGISILIAVPAGNWRGRTDLLINENDAKYIQKLHEDYPLLRRDITPVNNVDTGCRAVTYAIYITGTGEVLPCPFLHFTLGNVFEEKLSTILAKGHRVREFSEYHPKCLAGEDREFIEKYISKTFTCENLPMKVEDVFDLIR